MYNDTYEYMIQVVTVAKFHGGGAFNVIPDSVTIGGTFRAFSKENFMQLKQRIEEVHICVHKNIFNTGRNSFGSFFHML